MNEAPISSPEPAPRPEFSQSSPETSGAPIFSAPEPTPAASEQATKSPEPSIVPPSPPQEPPQRAEPARDLPLTPPPPPARPKVEEVIALPMTAAELRGPTIDVPRSETPLPPQPHPPPSTTTPAQTSSSNEPPRSSEPPPSSGTTGPPSAWRKRKEHLWAILCHLAFLLPGVIPGLIVTALIWQLAGKNDRQVEDQGREALNFQITVALLMAILGVSCLASPLVPIVWIVAAIYCVIAASTASDGENYRYPWVLRVFTH